LSVELKLLLKVGIVLPHFRNGCLRIGLLSSGNTLQYTIGKPKS
jgi:hypothetical protein